MAFYRQTAIILKRQLLQSIKYLQVQETRHIKRWVAPTLHELYRRREKVGPEPLKPRSTFLEWNYDAEIFAFGKRLGEEFDEGILRQALTHRSYVVQEEAKEQAESEKEISDNRELIKRGEHLIFNCIIKEFENEHPKILVNVIKNYLTSEKTLAQVSSSIGLGDIILCADFPVEESTLADSLKAIVAALEMSSTTERAELFVKHFIIVQLTGKDVYEMWDLQDAYEYLRALFRNRKIEPRLCNQSAANTILANYQVGLYSEQKLLGIGFGESIETAKNTAALDAIKRIFTGNKQLTN